jgi:hypothetical protein
MENIMKILNNFPKTVTRLDWCEVDDVVFEYEIVDVVYEYDDEGRAHPEHAATVRLLTVNAQQPTKEVVQKFQELIYRKRLVVDMTVELD